MLSQDTADWNKGKCHSPLQCLVVRSCLTLRAHGVWPTRHPCPWASPGKNTGVDCQALHQGIFPTQPSSPGFLHCRWILLLSEPPGKPKKTGVGSLSLLQGNFPTQESNWVLLHRRRILYQLSYQGSPISLFMI